MTKPCRQSAIRASVTVVALALTCVAADAAEAAVRPDLVDEIVASPRRGPLADLGLFEERAVTSTIRDGDERASIVTMQRVAVSSTELSRMISRDVGGESDITVELSCGVRGDGSPAIIGRLRVRGGRGDAEALFSLPGPGCLLVVPASSCDVDYVLTLQQATDE
jgi:hypothetical protein